MKCFLVKYFINLAVIITDLKFKAFGRKNMARVPIVKSGIGGGRILVTIPSWRILWFNNQSDKPMLDKILEYSLAANAVNLYFNF